MSSVPNPFEDNIGLTEEEDYATAFGTQFFRRLQDVQTAPCDPADFLLQEMGFMSINNPQATANDLAMQLEAMCIASYPSKAAWVKIANFDANGSFKWPFFIALPLADAIKKHRAWGPGEGWNSARRIPWNWSPNSICFETEHTSFSVLLRGPGNSSAITFDGPGNATQGYFCITDDCHAHRNTLPEILLHFVNHKLHLFEARANSARM